MCWGRSWFLCVARWALLDWPPPKFSRPWAAAILSSDRIRDQHEILNGRILGLEQSWPGSLRQNYDYTVQGVLCVVRTYSRTAVRYGCSMGCRDQLEACTGHCCCCCCAGQLDAGQRSIAAHDRRSCRQTPVAARLPEGGMPSYAWNWVGHAAVRTAGARPARG
jgi:hypothetical protein